MRVLAQGQVLIPRSFFMRCVFNTSLKIIGKLNRAVKLQALFERLHFSHILMLLISLKH